LTNLYPQFI